MTTRRNMLGASAAAAAGLVLGTRQLEAASSIEGVLTQPAGDMPPAIKALTSMRAQAPKPISVEERTARLEKARGLMRTNGIDALC
jgi:hypothetical protein